MDPGSGMETVRIRYPGWKKVWSGINIPDPQHWYKCYREMIGNVLVMQGRTMPLRGGGEAAPLQAQDPGAHRRQRRGPPHPQVQDPGVAAAPVRRPPPPHLPAQAAWGGQRVPILVCGPRGYGAQHQVYLLAVLRYLGIRIRDPVPFWPLDPRYGRVKRQNTDPWCTIQPESNFRELFGLKYLNSLMRIRDGKSSDPG